MRVGTKMIKKDGCQCDNVEQSLVDWSIRASLVNNEYKETIVNINSCFVSLLVFVCSTAEIPQFRLPYEVVQFEIDLMKDLGVKVPVRETWEDVRSFQPINSQMSLTLISVQWKKQANKTQLKSTLVRQVGKTSICPLPESCDGEKCQSIVLIQITWPWLIWF